MAKQKAVSLFKTDDAEQSMKQVTGDAPSVSRQADEVADIDLSAIRKKRFRINGNNSTILELNTSDLGVEARLEEEYKKLTAMLDTVGKALQDEPEDAATLNDTLNKLNQQMRESLDRIFDSNVSEMCAPFGNMWDPIDGAFRYEHIINTLTKLYESNLNTEFNKLRSRINRRVSEFTKRA